MIDLYYWTTPNGHKITVFLEEVALPYTIKPVNISKGEQFAAEFLAISPNNRIPAIVDHAPVDGGGPLAVFESGAILQYLARKTRKLLPADLRRHSEVMQWLFWQTSGLGPMLGQNHHFAHYAPEALPYAIDRYVKETERLYTVLDHRLRDREFIAECVLDRRYCQLSVDRSARATGDKARRIPPSQTLVQRDGCAAGGAARLRESSGDQHGADGHRSGQGHPVWARTKAGGLTTRRLDVRKRQVGRTNGYT